MNNPETVKLFNTLTRQVEQLNPLNGSEVGLYCCGPTVYNYQHIGNLRTYIFEDILVRTLRLAGYSVNHVMNITDVGHLVSDADEGEDKMALAAKREGKRSEDIAQYYTDIFFKHCDWLNILRPSVVCKATEHIEDMIALIKQLEEKDVAYVSGGNVYFDVSKYEKYPELARLDISQQQAGARIEVDSKKRNPQDFALWFTQSKFDNQELQWNSPWGRGYPGWHIECSAMSIKYLGEHFDIHCGGIDHIPVHHTNERAQSEAATGKPFANIWMHGAFLLTASEKMSKSTGDFLTLDKLKERNIDPLAYRLFCMSASYRKELNWSWEAIEGAASTLKKLQKSYTALLEQATGSTELGERALNKLATFKSFLFNDLGLPQAVATVHEALGDALLSADEKIALLSQFDEVLGLGVESWSKQEAIPEEIVKLASEREEARAKKNWALADELRDTLTQKGYVVKDSAQGSKIEKL